MSEDFLFQELRSADVDTISQRALIASRAFRTRKNALRKDFEEQLQSRRAMEFRENKPLSNTNGFRATFIYLHCYMFKNALVTAIPFIIHAALPITLLWSLRPAQWHRYIILTVTLIWSWIVLIVWNLYAVRYVLTNPYIFSGAGYVLTSKRWAWRWGIRLFWIYLLAVYGYTIAYVPLMIYVGETHKAGESGNWAVRLAISIVVPLLVAALLLILVSFWKAAHHECVGRLIKPRRCVHSLAVIRCASCCIGDLFNNAMMIPCMAMGCVKFGAFYALYLQDAYVLRTGFMTVETPTRL